MIAAVIDAGVDWQSIHAATERAAAADYAATGDSLAGWGGTGPFCHREQSSLGLARLYAQTSVRLHAAWELCHRLRAPVAEHPDDLAAWCVERPSGAVFVAASRRGALVAATRSGGRVFRGVDELRRARRIARDIDRLRRAVEFALAIGGLYDEVTMALGGTLERTICCVRAGMLSIQGPAWWRGCSRDEGAVNERSARAFVAGAPLAVLHPFARIPEMAP